MVDDAAAFAAPAPTACGQKAVGGGAAPLRIAGREMHADIAVREGAEERVGQRVQDHVAVRMGLDPRRAGTRTPPSQT